jgi:hypothetical protein
MKTKALIGLGILVLVGLAAIGIAGGDSATERLLLSRSFYYAETCEDNIVYENRFFRDHFVESQIDTGGKRLSALKVSVALDGDTMMVKDGEHTFPCKISAGDHNVLLKCKHESGWDRQLLYDSAEMAIQHRPPCLNE